LDITKKRFQNPETQTLLFLLYWCSDYFASVLQLPAYFTKYHTLRAAWESTRRIFDFLSTSLTYADIGNAVHDLSDRCMALFISNHISVPPATDCSIIAYAVLFVNDRNFDANLREP